MVSLSDVFSRDAHPLRVMGAMVLVLVGCLALVEGWPLPTRERPALPFSSRPAETIEIEEIQPTAQAREMRPPPPAPLPPIVVPNDRLIEEPFELEDANLPLDEVGEDDQQQDGTNARTVASQRPDVEARLLRAVQPPYPPEAQKDDIRAQVVVEVLVGVRGRVLEATVLRRVRLENGTARPVASLGYGLDEAALTAARRSLFRPAQAAGESVPSRRTITFTFGN